MENKVRLSLGDIDCLSLLLATRIERHFPSLSIRANSIKVYGVPRGGISAAYALGKYLRIHMVEDPQQADLIIDDIIDSGLTELKFRTMYPLVPFYALISKVAQSKYRDKWIVFPWECKEDGTEETVEDNIVRLLQYVGENPNRGGLIETPKRVAKAWGEWTRGYKQDAAEILKTFEDGAEQYDQMVTVKDIPFYSHCEHHMAPFFGTCTISYIPNKKIVGLSKLSRIVGMFANRLQVQERLTSEIAEALHTHLQPLGVGVSINARHMCMESRGICQQGHHTVTTALKGFISQDATAKREFLDQIK